MGRIATVVKSFIPSLIYNDVCHGKWQITNTSFAFREIIFYINRQVLLHSVAREQRFIKNIFFYFKEAILKWDKMLNILGLPSVGVTGSVELA